MDDRRISLSLTVCAVALITGCATAPGVVELNANNTKIQSLYRVEQPVGTAAGQYAVGRLKLAEGRVDTAIVRFRQALQLDPNYVEALNGLGVAYGELGRFDDAIGMFRSALASGPASAHVLNNLGYAQLKAGRLYEASESLQRSLRLDTVNQRTRENLALLAQAREQAAQAAVARPAEHVASTEVQRATTESAPALRVAAATMASEPVAAAPAAAATIAPEPATPEPSVATATMAPEPFAAEPIAAEPTAAEPLAAAPAAVQPQPVDPVAVQPVRAAAVELVPSTQTPGAIDWAARLVSATQSIAATALDEAGGAPAASYQVVISRSADAALVQVAPNVYQLEPAVKTATVARSQPASAAAAAVQPAHRTGATVAASRTPPARMSLSAIDGLEVSNGAGVSRLATSTAHQLARFGAEVARITNYRSFDRKVTEIQYRDGHLGGAMAVQQRLPVGAKLVPTGNMNSGVNVRLVLGRDMVVTHVASWYDKAPAVEPTAAAPAPVQAAVAPEPAEPAAPQAMQRVRPPATQVVASPADAGTIAHADREDGWRYM